MSAATATVLLSLSTALIAANVVWIGYRVRRLDAEVRELRSILDGAQ